MKFHLTAASNNMDEMYNERLSNSNFNFVLDEYDRYIIELDSVQDFSDLQKLVENELILDFDDYWVPYGFEGIITIYDDYLE